MAREFKNLIRLHEFRVDEQRRKLGELLRMLEDLEKQAQRLEVELVDEQQIAARTPGETDLTYGAYANAVIERRERIAASIAEAEEYVAQARDELADEYQDLKKYEIAQENRDRRAALAEARREQGLLDELGLQSHRRRVARAATARAAD